MVTTRGSKMKEEEEIPDEVLEEEQDPDVGFEGSVGDLLIGPEQESSLDGMANSFANMNFDTTPMKQVGTPMKQVVTPGILGKATLFTPSKKAPKTSSTISKYSLSGGNLEERMRLNGNGSKDNPHWVDVYPETPERNVAGFWVQYVRTMKHNGYERQGFDIRRVQEPDMNKWTATIPDNLPGFLKGRAILFARPSVSVFYANNRRYHSACGNYCDNTRDAHSVTLNDIRSNPTRAWEYFLTVFPPGIALDNRIFSADDNIVSGNGVMLSKRLEEGQSARYGAMYWRIGLKGGNKMEDRNRGQSFAALFRQVNDEESSSGED